MGGGVTYRHSSFDLAAYMEGDRPRARHEGRKVEGNLGEQMWQKFVRKHKNIFMVLCGHHYGEAVCTSIGDHGNQVHQVLSDYQHLNDGGESWLRYMVFQPEENRIGIYTYTPVLDRFSNEPSSRFDLDYPMAQPPEAVLGTTRPGDANAVENEAEQSPSGDAIKVAPEE